jgi:hypothetical protein
MDVHFMQHIYAADEDAGYSCQDAAVAAFAEANAASILKWWQVSGADVWFSSSARI